MTEAALPEKVGAEGDVVRMRPEWLPDAPHTTKMGLGLVQVPPIRSSEPAAVD